MIVGVDRLLRARSWLGLTVGAYLLVFVIGVIDHLTGFELSFSIFYLMPISLASWYVGKRVGISVSVASALTWFIVDHTSGHPYSQEAIPVWNAIVRLGFFLITGYLLVQLRTALRDQAMLAQRDSLTGLLNSRTFGSHCKRLFDLAARHRHSLSLGFIDVDNFKRLNDSLGHSAGDAVLKSIADALENRMRASDLVGRLGGDEFAILLPETGAAGATAIFSELHKHLNELAVWNKWEIGFSIGVAVFDSPPADPDEGVRLADELMYGVKRDRKGGLLVQQVPLGA